MVSYGPMEKMHSDDGRLFSLDFLRGVDMFLLTVIGPLVWALDAAFGLPDAILYQFTHPWEGFTLWDIIMPLFLFMCGASIPLSLERRIERNGGRAGAGYWKHVIWRVALLWTLGMLVQGHLADLDLMALRPYNNTLQTIAVGYLAMAALVACCSMRIRILVPALCFVLYGLLVHFGGDYTMTGNFAEIVEQKVLAAVLPAASQAIHEVGELGYLGRFHEIGEIHYTWLLTSLMFVFMTACGYFSTKLVTSTQDRFRNARRLSLFGLALLCLGWALTFAGVRMVKHIFTVSFTAQAMGWSALGLALAYLVTDALRIRKGLSLFVLFGRTSLVAYLIGEFFWPCYMFAGDFVTHGLSHIAGKPVQQLVACCVAIGLLISTLAIRRRLAATRGVAERTK